MELSVIRTLGLLCLSHLCLDQVAGMVQNCSKFDVYDGETKVSCKSLSCSPSPPGAVSSNHFRRSAQCFLEIVDNPVTL